MEKCKDKEDEAIYFSDGSGFVHNVKIGYGWIRKGQKKIFKAYVKKLKYEKDVEVELIYLPTYSPNLNLIERLWKYAKKKVVGIYYDRFHKFKEAVENFFENEVKKESCKADLRSFIGTSFQIVKG